MSFCGILVGIVEKLVGTVSAAPDIFARFPSSRSLARVSVSLNSFPHARSRRVAVLQLGRKTFTRRNRAAIRKIVDRSDEFFLQLAVDDQISLIRRVIPRRKSAFRSRIFYLRHRKLYMKTSRFTDSQIIAILKQAEAGSPVPELCREHGIRSSFANRYRPPFLTPVG
jgi:putative transposase